MSRVEISEGLVKRLARYQDSPQEPVERTVRRVLDLLEEDLLLPPELRNQLEGTKRAKPLG